MTSVCSLTWAPLASGQERTTEQHTVTVRSSVTDPVQLKAETVVFQSRLPEGKQITDNHTTGQQLPNGQNQRTAFIGQSNQETIFFQ